MRRRPSLALLTALVSVLLIGAQVSPAAAATGSFGAKLDQSSQPSNAEGGQKCSDNGGIPAGSVCTWVGVEAYHNGDNFKAPKAGTIRKLKLVSCIAGTFTLQIARAAAGASTRSSGTAPKISYKADPFVSDGDPDTFCGGEDGIYKVQTFPISVHVDKGDLIAVKAKKLGTLYCAGGSGVKLITPALSPGQPSTPDATAGCDLLIKLVYG